MRRQTSDAFRPEADGVTNEEPWPSVDDRRPATSPPPTSGQIPVPPAARPRTLAPPHTAAAWIDRIDPHRAAPASPRLRPDARGDRAAAHQVFRNSVD